MVCLLTWKTCNYEFDFECTFINFPHTALYILKSTQNRCADNNKNTNGKILEKEIRKIFLIKSIQIRTQICKRILHNIQLYDLIIIANLISEIKFHDMLFLHILRIIFKNDQS